MSRKSFVLGLALVICFMFNSCKKSEYDLGEKSTSINVKNNSVEEIQNELKSKKRQEYNKNNYNKNLFLQFLHDEIPIIDYGKKGNTVYFSEISKIYEINKLEKSETDLYYIIDMDGDGEQEFCYNYMSFLDIIKYNDEKNCFELWFSDTNKYRPIGNKQMYFESLTAANVYSYVYLDDIGKIIDEKVYSFQAKGGLGKDGLKIIYEIDFEEVTEIEWKEKSAYLFDVISKAEKPFNYFELLVE